METPTGQLKINGWQELTREYPDREVIAAILGICQFGARIGFEMVQAGPKIYPNLQSALMDKDLVTQDITAELTKKRIKQYRSISSLPVHFTASPIGLTDKSDGTKRRIHHLSHPTSAPGSINYGIPEHYGALVYSTIHEAVQAIQEFGRDCVLVKRDFQSAFRHIPVSPMDSPLLGFQWGNSY